MWSNYIDVEDENDLEDKDRVTVVPITSPTDSEALTTQVRPAPQT